MDVVVSERFEEFILLAECAAEIIFGYLQGCDGDA